MPPPFYNATGKVVYNGGNFEDVADSHRSQISHLSKMYILLVDDNDELSDNLRLVLEIEGFQVRAVASASAALGAIKQKIPDLILADVVMPGQNGYDLFQLVRANQATAQVPFIFLSAAATSDDLDRYHQLGAEGYITKPFSLYELLTIVRRYIQ